MGNGMAGPADKEPDANGRRRLNERYAPYVISPVLLKSYTGEESRPVIIDPNLDHPLGVDEVRRQLEQLVKDVGGSVPPGLKSRQHVFADLTLKQLQALIQEDKGNALNAGLRLG